jgi:glycosyltransferase involved in cell wall biosynthesis
MAAADVVTLTSRWEGMPYALLEAMAWGRPVVATAVNGCPEVVVDGVTGFLVSPGDPAAWARRVLDLLENPAQAVAFGQHGRRRAEEQFALSQLIARLESLYDLCLQPTFTVQ